MAFGKRATLAFFLIISLRLSAVCCDDYLCELIPDETICKGRGCLYDNGKCREEKCSDRTNCRRDWKCWNNGSACVEAAQCSDYDSTSCTYTARDANDTRCFYDNGKCRKATCSDYTTSEYCKDVFDVGKSGNICIWYDGTCESVTSCSDYNGDPNRCPRNCLYRDNFCKNRSELRCAEFGESDCGTYGEEVDGKYRACRWENSACRVPECNDFSGEGNSIPCLNWLGLECDYVNDSICVPLNCANMVGCAYPCHYLTSCPAPGSNSTGAAARLFAPELWVVLLLVLFW